LWDGEECLARGFEYFDFSDKNLEFYGFCYPTAVSKSLAIRFVDAELEKNPPHFVVENLNNKTLTRLKTGDEVLSINGQPSEAMWKFKYAVFKANSEKSSEMQLGIKRGSEVMTISEPLANFSGYLQSPTGL
jgi:hypothetical protein